MIKRIINWLRGKPEVLDENPYVPNWPPIDWQPIVERIRPHVESHVIYLQLKDGSFIKLEEVEEICEAISVAVAYPIDNVKRWETEVPAKHMIEKLAKLLDREVLHLINRDPKFNGCHYACIANT
ncbi:MAG: hypothetical protein KBT77_03000 [Thalassolituus oleivorans]|uniref:hypothetical protein n=1 Tax=Thalassolituus oleivorans TaxID=187493 RepID=UPI001B785483|nr:hypothetical protein [Thalassolituus oleivorans]MBQ0726302.1 hypothetical protein [Thalassolituus oleivorans]